MESNALKTLTIKEKELLLIKIIDKVFVENGIWYTLSHGSALGAVRHSGFIPWDEDIDICVFYDDVPKIRRVLNSNTLEETFLIMSGAEKGYYSYHDRYCFKNDDYNTCHIDIFPLIGMPEDYKKRVKYAKHCYHVVAFLSSKHKKIKHSSKKNRFLRFVFKVFTLVIPDKIINNTYKKLSEKYSLSESTYCGILGDNYAERNIQKIKDIKELSRIKFEQIELNIMKEYDKYLTNVYGDYMIPIKYDK